MYIFANLKATNQAPDFIEELPFTPFFQQAVNTKKMRSASIICLQADQAGEDAFASLPSDKQQFNSVALFGSNLVTQYEYHAIRIEPHAYLSRLFE